MTKSSSPDEPSSLWSFTLERYSHPGVQQSAISLQDRLGVDVNLLFYCVWHAETGRGRLASIDFRQVDMRIAHWRSKITLPLRQLRTILKDDPGLAGLRDALDVRGKILAAEIDSERIAQIAIESDARPPNVPEEDPVKRVAEDNLRSYLAYADSEIDADAGQDVERFLDGVLSG